MPAAKRGQARIGGGALPAEGERDLAGALGQIEGFEMLSDCMGERIRVDVVGAGEIRLQDLEVALRQERLRVGDVDGVAAELDGIFRRAEGGGADAFAGREQRPGQGAAVELLAQRFSEQAAEVAEIARLAAVDELGDAAREHHAAEVTAGVEPVRQEEAFGSPADASVGRRRATSASAIQSATRCMSSGVTVSPSDQSRPARAARCLPAGSRRTIAAGRRRRRRGGRRYAARPWR